MATPSAEQVYRLTARFLAGDSFAEYWLGFVNFVGDDLDRVGFTPQQVSAFDLLYERVYMAHAGLTTAEGRAGGLTGEEELRDFLRAFPWESIGAKPI